jgi:hypothetical protein
MDMGGAAVGVGASVAGGIEVGDGMTADGDGRLVSGGTAFVATFGSGVFGRLWLAVG